MIVLIPSKGDWLNVLSGVNTAVPEFHLRPLCG